MNRDRWIAPRLLIIPGLGDSGPAHWQTWLQARHRHAVRVEQDDWLTPDLSRWAAQIAQTLETLRGTPVLVAAHSFGCLALARHQVLRPDLPVAAALLVAPADPDKFGVGSMLPRSSWGLPSTLVASDTDPWMAAARARDWAQRWGSAFVNLGDAGHINAEAGFGPLPLAQRWVVGASQRLAHQWRIDTGEAQTEPQTDAQDEPDTGSADGWAALTREPRRASDGPTCWAMAA